MCETCKNGIYPTKWSDVEGKSGIASLACPDCGKLFWGDYGFPHKAAQQGVQWTLATVWQKLVALFRRQSH